MGEPEPEFLPIGSMGLRGVINKIKDISQKHYRGKLHDNVLNVFQDLTEEERKTFIRGVMHISSVVETGVSLDREVKILDAPVNRVTEAQAMAAPVISSEIERLNQEALVNLRSWVAKVVIVSVIFGFIFIVGISIAVTSEADNFVLKLLGSLGTVLQVIFAE